MNSWETGAQQLTQEQRVSLANDPLNLLPSMVRPTARRARRRGDLAPPKKDFRCAYVAHQVSVKATYSLWVHPAGARRHREDPRHLSGRACSRSGLHRCGAASTCPCSRTGACSCAGAGSRPRRHRHPPRAGARTGTRTGPAPAYYENCDAVRAAGAAPIHAGDPGSPASLTVMETEPPANRYEPLREVGRARLALTAASTA